jgi:5S rRNA maturation endonuclease (ribonuclease M5)
MTTMMLNKSHLNDQYKLKALCDDLVDNLEDLLLQLNFEYRTGHKMITMCCPIHKGDNVSALNIYTTGDSYKGNWVCRTHNCEKIFKNSIIGFIRGVISAKKYGWSTNNDKMASFKETLDYCYAYLEKDYQNFELNAEDKNKTDFTKIINYISDGVKTKDTKITRNFIRSQIKIPSGYYLNRGYSGEILEKYDVGLCDNPNKPMYNRVVVPVYDSSYSYMVGCTGRSIFEKCESCSLFHEPSDTCPDSGVSYLYSKWKHSANFKSQNYLYNFWFAKDYIMKTSTAIIVESPGNVWKLEQNNIHNSVAIFGCNLSSQQKMILDSSGAMNLIIIMDNDKAGQEASEKIQSLCKNTYRVFSPQINKNDIAEMNSEEIEQYIKQYVENIK